MPLPAFFRKLRQQPASSLLTRTFLLIAGLVLLITLAWVLLFRLLATEPRARDAAELAASAVNLVRAALIASAPARRPDLFAELRDSEGIRLLPKENNDHLLSLPDNYYHRRLQEHILTRLGKQTKLARAVNDEPGFWISFRLDQNDDDEYWVVLPNERTRHVMAWHWLAWGSLALLLALLVAWRIASRLTRPLARLASAAAELGDGRRPEALPEHGAKELQQLAAAFNRMAADLERNERDRAEVLAGISHDLRTPLTRLRLEAEMSLNDEATRLAVVADIEQMESVIAQFLDYARGEGGEPEVFTSPNDLLDAIAIQQKYHGRQLINDLKDIPPTRHHPKALNRAVTNLLDNAFKYAGGQVTLACRIENKNWVIEVIDSGPGIPEAETEQVKRPFKRLNTARSDASGTGLGLAIVERIARFHEGTLALMPREPNGLIARLTLKIRAESE